MVSLGKADSVRGQLDLLLLAVLRDGPAHGYDVIASLAARSSGTFELPEGTVYPALHRLEDDGLLQSSWADVGGRRRRTYRITPAGGKVLAAKRESWRLWVRSVDSVIGAAS